MKSVLVIFAFAVLVQLLLAVDDPPPEYSGLDGKKDGKKDEKKEAPAEQPQKKIKVPTYRPNAREFLSDFNMILFKLILMRSIEPRICEQMMERVNENLSRFNLLVFADMKRIQETFRTSKSDKLSNAITDAQTANSKVLDAFTELATKFLKEIYDNCVQLRTYNMRKEIIQKIVRHQKDQLDAATKLANLPEKYENDMQAHYTPIEKIIGPQ